MTSTQKLIKYLAVCLAIFLIITILSIVILGISSLGSIFGIHNSGSNKCNYNNVNSLDIDVVNTNITIKDGETFSIDSTSENTICKNNGSELVIKEKNKLLNLRSSDLTIYIPKDYEFDEVSINTNVGKLEIDSIISNELDLDLGKGSTFIKYLKSNNTSIETGVGKLEIASSDISNLDFDMGVGKAIINTTLTGRNEIDANVGSLELNLFGNKNDYKIKLDGCVGKNVIDNEKVSSDAIYGSGRNLINIDGGVGKIEINFRSE